MAGIWLRLSLISPLTCVRAKTKLVRGMAEIVPADVEWKPIEPELTYDPRTSWTNKSKRVGAIGVKLGMTSDWTDKGDLVALTAIQIPNCKVLSSRITAKAKGSFAYKMQVAARDTVLKKTPKALQGVFAQAGIEPKKTIMEFDVTQDALLPPGTEILAKHFVPGQLVTLQGITRGKGFEGVMGRYGFAGQPASHGVSLTHRSLGSTGNRKSPGRVFKGKKMPGNHGNKLRTVMNLQVYMVDPVHNIIYVRGAVPGTKGTVIRVKDALWQAWKRPPPFPVYQPTGNEDIDNKPMILVKEPLSKQKEVDVKEVKAKYEEIQKSKKLKELELERKRKKKG